MSKDCTPNPNLQLLFSGALAHLAHYLDSGCERSAYLARMVLEQLAQSSDDRHLGREIGLLIEVLETRADLASVAPATTSARPACGSQQRIAA
ncbi:MAG: hypothetical protein QM739_01720 [Propionivibrio sp.]